MYMLLSFLIIFVGMGILVYVLIKAEARYRTEEQPTERISAIQQNASRRERRWRK